MVRQAGVSVALQALAGSASAPQQTVAAAVTAAKAATAAAATTVSAPTRWACLRNSRSASPHPDDRSARVASGRGGLKPRAPIRLEIREIERKGAKAQRRKAVDFVDHAAHCFDVRIDGQARKYEPERSGSGPELFDGALVNGLDTEAQAAEGGAGGLMR